MRFEFHIVIDFNAMWCFIKRQWIRRYGVPQYSQSGEIWGYEYKGTTYCYAH